MAIKNYSMATQIGNSIYLKEFKCGRTEITRGMLEALPEPFNTINVSDETMQEIADEVEQQMQDYYQWEEDDSISHDKVEEKWWEILENIVVDKQIPYYFD